MVMMLKTSRLLGEEGIEFFYTKDEHTNMNIISKLMLGGGGGGGGLLLRCEAATLFYS